MLRFLGKSVRLNCWIQKPIDFEIEFEMWTLTDFNSTTWDRWITGKTGITETIWCMISNSTDYIEWGKKKRMRCTKILQYCRVEKKGDQRRVTYSHLAGKHLDMDRHIYYWHRLLFDHIQNFVHILADIQYKGHQSILVNRHTSQHRYARGKQHLLRRAN